MYSSSSSTGCSEVVGGMGTGEAGLSGCSVLDSESELDHSMFCFLIVDRDNDVLFGAGLLDTTNGVRGLTSNAACFLLP